jgi:maleate isomerase
MTGQTSFNASPDSPARPAPVHAAREYGRAGLFGIVTPPGNPTVEPELRILLPAGAAMLASRLGAQATALRPKLIEYLDNLDRSLASFADLAFDGLGFACTGSSYLVAPDDERRRLDALSAARNYPVLSAAGAIGAALNWLGARAIALVSPYPEWLTAASRAHWERTGMRVTNVLQLPAGPPPGASPESHGIYELTTESVLARIAGFDPMGADIVLISGTGMPSLRLIVALGESQAAPVLSSNLCLAWALAKLRGAAAPGPESPLYGGWRERIGLT